MSFVLFASSIAPSPQIKQYKLHSSASQNNSSPTPSFSCVHCRSSRHIMESVCKLSRNEMPNMQMFTARSSMGLDNQTLDNGSFDWEDVEEVDMNDMGSPWEGAIIYKRNPSILHMEYCTTLERLGLKNLSTEISKSRASVMGIRVTKPVKDYPLGTPVQISIDVTRKRKYLRIDGIVKTVITLGCNRCGEPAAKNVFSNFSILLTEEPVEEPEIIDMGAIFSKDNKPSSHQGSIEEAEDYNEASIDWDDRLHFPPERKEIDISKNIRDLVHVEIAINATCDPNCKGLCLKCGTNLNASSCSCSKEKAEEKKYGPLKNLREQLQAKSQL